MCVSVLDQRYAGSAVCTSYVVLRGEFLSDSSTLVTSTKSTLYCQDCVWLLNVDIFSVLVTYISNCAAKYVQKYLPSVCSNVDGRLFVTQKTVASYNICVVAFTVL